MLSGEYRKLYFLEIGTERKLTLNVCLTNIIADESNI